MEIIYIFYFLRQILSTTLSWFSWHCNSNIPMYFCLILLFAWTKKNLNRENCTWWLGDINPNSHEKGDHCSQIELVMWDIGLNNPVSVAPCYWFVANRDWIKVPRISINRGHFGHAEIMVCFTLIFVIIQLQHFNLHLCPYFKNWFDLK